MKAAVIVPNFNSGPLVTRCVSALLSQELDPSHTVEIVVVDDCSTDGSAGVLSNHFGERVRVIRLTPNRGRSTTRNAGAAATEADLLIFVDSDCIPSGNRFVAAHIRAALSGTDVVFGEVNAPGTGFWDQLQNASLAGRVRRFQAGDKWVFTTGNVAVRSALFKQAGGFDPIFDRHGFEDRDLFLRLEKLGASVQFSEEARVRHEDKLTLSSVARKLGDAGFYSSRDFSDRHPEAYRRMPFSRLDCSLRPWLLFVDACFSPLAVHLARGRNRWIDWMWLPFRAKAFLVRAFYGICYLNGTARRLRAISRPTHARIDKSK